MHFRLPVLLGTIAFIVTSCNTQQKKEASSTKATPELETPVVQKLSDAERILAATYKAHGGDLYSTAAYSFTFRKKEYNFVNKGYQFRYEVNYEEKGTQITNVLENGTLTGFENGKEVRLTQKDIDKYTEALNSVIYFATLPHKLNDKAVNKAYKGTTKIKGVSYDILEIMFEQEGGGKDFDDEFHYWINQETHIIDYIAYNYTVNEGGVRFRVAFNPRKVGGIHFQDYVNYKAPLGTPLKDLPSMYENGTLEEMSKIKTEDIKIKN